MTDIPVSSCMNVKEANELARVEYEKLRQRIFRELRDTFNVELREAIMRGQDHFTWRAVDHSWHLSKAMEHELIDFVCHLEALGYGAVTTTSHHTGLINGYICAWGDDPQKTAEEWNL